PRPPSSTLFPYTTLFRSSSRLSQGQLAARLEFAEALLLIQWQLALRNLRQNAAHLLRLLPLPCGLGRMQPQQMGFGAGPAFGLRSEEHTSELQSRENLVC